MIHYTSQSPELLVLLVLYLRAQHDLYVDYHDGFIQLADWFELLREEPGGELHGGCPTMDGPDICGHCLYTYADTPGGRVREGCPVCQGDTPHKDRALHTIWSYKFCELLGVTPAYFDYHLALALTHLRNHRNFEKEGATS